MEGETEAPLVADDEGASGGEKNLDVALNRLERFLALLGFPNTPSRARLAASCAAFLLLGVAVPSAAICLSRCSQSRGDEYEVQQFELCVLVSEASLAAVSLGAVSRNLLKYGVRRFLFVDQHHGRFDRLQQEYVCKIQELFRLLLWCILPCFVVKTAREIVRFLYIFHESRWRSIVVFLASTMSWVYLTIIVLSACMLFNLVCSLQVIHFEDYGKLLEREVDDALICLEEHLRLRYYLSQISHRFRMFLLLLFLFVTASQFVILLQTTGYSGKINFADAGDIAVSSVVQVIALLLCLNAASKISHRAQGVASLASRWNAYADPQIQSTTNGSEAIPPSSSLMDYSESDSESLENIALHHNAQLLSSFVSSYHKRQALGR
ncbi:hypothetical protein OPV22_028854 [Ensete ventricosum]|uniref:Uncharacterized protein n=1 Tax=Ensete ventricosum TaxID=4639 RepID=A0AAV8P6R4_ENSVE|nr:hypothetical protein OPV22_028854 [Ensete ventricosum]